MNYYDSLNRIKLIKRSQPIQEWRIKHPNDLNRYVGIQNIKWEHSKRAKEKD